LSVTIESASAGSHAYTAIGSAPDSQSHLAVVREAQWAGSHWQELPTYAIAVVPLHMWVQRGFKTRRRALAVLEQCEPFNDCWKNATMMPGCKVRLQCFELLKAALGRCD
jgi:hypothetical protein